MNYGLLSLASVLKRGGLNPVVIHGGFDNPADVLRTAIGCQLATSNHPVLVSIPSFYSVSWAHQFISLLKELQPGRRVIVGGRWVVGDDPELLKQRLPGADMVIAGMAESHIASLVAGDSATCKGGQPNELSNLDYSLLYRRAEYQPSIEVSRGCGMGCSFCQERDMKRTSLKAPASVVSQLHEILIRDQWAEMTPYFEASMFVPNRLWIGQLQRCLDVAGLSVKWRTEARVDSLDPGLIPVLAKTGLSVIDLGLESASPRQLLRMKKTKNPDKYLSRASALLRACSSHGVRVKLNILLSAGEDLKSIDQTTEWMERHRSCIYGVSAGPVMAYGWPETIENHLKSLASAGAKPCGSPCDGVTWLDLSDEIDCARALEIANLISREFMSDRHYYALKSFSYFPRSYSFIDFESDLAIDRSGIPFGATVTGAPAMI